MARELLEDKSRSMTMGFSYSSATNPAAIQSFDQPEIYNLTTGMDMMAFSKTHSTPPDMWKTFFTKTNPAATSAAAPGPSSSTANNDFYQPHHFDSSADLIDQAGAVSWQGHVDDSSLRCVFPCEGNERPSQGLSLSLSSTNPSGIGLQSFELRHTQNGFPDQMMTVGDMNFQLRHSKYLSPAQELLNEFCSLETTTKQHHKNKHLEADADNITSSSSRNNKLSSSSSSSSLYSLDIIELQRRKAKLMSMLEEVDRRYRHYCDQMKAVESVLDSAAGAGSATVYSALASKAMSRHFRCLRDGIAGQIQETKRAIGEKEPVAAGASRGETPRLRVLDQSLRQQRAFQQMTMMETHPWRPQRGLPERSVSVLRAWLFEHFLHPYPSDVDKHILARQTGLSRSQVSNWFINARVRLWKPMVEEMYVEETKEQDNLNNSNNMGASSDGVTATDPDDDPSGRPNNHEDHKPTPNQLVRIDSECLSSIITNPDKDSSSKMHMHHSNYGTTSYGAMEMDFASYNQNGVSFGHHHGGVSLTLGLQQHGNNVNGGGVSLAFSPTASHQSSLFYPRDHHHQQQQQHQAEQPNEHHEMEPVVQYTMMDGEGQNLPYRNLMGAQLLHDLAG